MAKYRVVVSERAGRMLGEHMRFLAKANKDAARKAKARLMAEIRSLDEMPQHFPFFEGTYIPPNRYHKMYVENWYIVLYQIKDDTVFVDYILDCRKEYPWLIK